MQASIVVAVGGAIGSLLRYWCTLWLMPISRDMPWSTIFINIVGSFAIGFFAMLTLPTSRFALPEIWRLAFMVGICGGFTTFSAFSLQTFELLRLGMPGRAFLNIGVSVFACLAATAFGYMAAQYLNKL
ncbi:fluoride efflux transporter CrcB [Brucella sp. BE17]|uniref:fluoride efflux transporter CrcB n=1 Tax=Brucella sp. BE17 TaxID=3142977 RepID=UPI0031BA02AE